MDSLELDPDPHVQFDRWYADAVSAGVRHPEQMALATATREAAPSVRMVLLKGYDARGFVFYTNRTSRKAVELEENPRAALTLSLGAPGASGEDRRGGRRRRGATSLPRTSARAREAARSRLGVAAVRGARKPGRARAARRGDRGAVCRDEVPLPPFWGGYRVLADAIEFWQGRPDRLHDRVRYELDDGGWARERLGP